MASNYPWFKFDADTWLTGNIRNASDSLRGVFASLCVLWWKDKRPVIIDESLHLRCGCRWKWLFMRRLNTLEHVLNVIETTENGIDIKFLNEQWEEQLETIRKKQKAGKASAETRSKKRKNKQVFNTTSTPVQHVLNTTPTDKDLDLDIYINKHIQEEGIKFPITETLKKRELPREIIGKFIKWMGAYQTSHGKMPTQSQDMQLARILKLPEDRRIPELDNAIAGSWKNINDTRVPLPAQQEEYRNDRKIIKFNPDKNRKQGDNDEWRKQFS